MRPQVMKQEYRMAPRPLRICLLTYRGNPRSGGQGIYVRLLSQALVGLGHEVDVWSGPPYPDLPPGVGLTPVPSLDLWNEHQMMRTPNGRELRDPINLREWARTRLGGFVEPLTFAERVARRFRQECPLVYDIVHDNQCLGPGLLSIQKSAPVVATIHHPVTVDRRIAFQDATSLGQRFGLRQFYAFLPAQLRVSRQLERIITVSEASQSDIHHEYGVPLHRMRVVGNGIDVTTFRPLSGHSRDPLRLITTLSSDAPLKGFRFLLDALKQLRSAGRDLRLLVIGKPGEKTDTRARIERMGLHPAITFTGRIEAAAIAEHYAKASVAVVPSLYEGFGYPAGEAMACEVPVVSTSAGALPEVVGNDGRTGVLVEPASGQALARGIEGLLDAPERAREIGRAGRARVLAQFTWEKAAEKTVEVYLEALAVHRAKHGGASCSP